MSRHSAVYTMVAVVFVVGCNPPQAVSDSYEKPGVLQVASLTATPLAGSSAGTGTLSWSAPPPSDEPIWTAPEVLSVPDVITAGEPFEAVVHTGGDGCWAPARQQVEVQGRTVELRPIDQHSGAKICTMIFSWFRHASMVTIPEPGEWTIRVVGRRLHYDRQEDMPIAAELSVVVH